MVYGLWAWGDSGFRGFELVLGWFMGFGLGGIRDLRGFRWFWPQVSEIWGLGD